jgi:hypothetical protein
MIFISEKKCTFAFQIFFSIKTYKMITTAIIDNSNVQTTNFAEHASNLPFTKGVTEKKKSFEEACKECNAVTIDFFVNELENRVKQRYRNANS